MESPFRDENSEKNQRGREKMGFFSQAKIIGLQIQFQAEDKNVGSEIEAVRKIVISSMHKEYDDLKSNAIYSLFNVITIYERRNLITYIPSM